MPPEETRMKKNQARDLYLALRLTLPRLSAKPCTEDGCRTLTLKGRCSKHRDLAYSGKPLTTATTDSRRLEP